MTEIPTLDSKEELYMWWYLEELFERGVITGFQYHSERFDLISPAQFNWKYQKKNKTEEMTSTIFRGHSYTPAYIVVFAPEYASRFIVNINRINLVANAPGNILKKIPLKGTGQTTGIATVAIIDVKGEFHRWNDGRSFSMDQKLVWAEFGLYVNEILPTKLFKQTFVPARYVRTDKDVKDRLINFPHRSLDQFLQLPPIIQER